MHLVLQLIHLLLNETSSEVRSLKWKGNLEQNYLRTELNISENRSYRVIKSNLKFLNQIINNMHREGQEGSTMTTAICKTVEALSGFGAEFQQVLLEILSKSIEL